MGFPEAISDLSDILDRVVSWLTAASAGCFTVLIFVTVLSRYVFNFSILFSQEVCKLLFVWSCFFAATIVYKRKAHIKFEFAESFLGVKGVAVTDLLIYAASLAFFGVVLWQSISFVRQIWATFFPLIDISQGWLYLSVVVSTVVFICHNLNFFTQRLLSLRQSNRLGPTRRGGH